MLETFITGIELVWEFVCSVVWFVVNVATGLVHLAVATLLGITAIGACLVLFPILIMLGILDWIFTGKKPLEEQSNCGV